MSDYEESLAKLGHSVDGFEAEVEAAAVAGKTLGWLVTEMDIARTVLAGLIRQSGRSDLLDTLMGAES